LEASLGYIVSPVFKTTTMKTNKRKKKKQEIVSINFLYYKQCLWSTHCVSVSHVLGPVVTMA
jgi:hypothetical protein